jgi:gliding motility-associated lipoprotein GldH
LSLKHTFLYHRIGRPRNFIAQGKFHSVYKVLIIFAFSFFLVSCEENLVFEKYTEIRSGQWTQNEHIEFDVDISDTSSLHNFYINLRHGGNYQFSNIFLFIGSKMPDGKTFRDTLECALAANDGKWFGKGIGDIRDIRVLFKKNLAFPMKGRYHFSIEQAMRMNPLPYVFDVGIRLEKVKAVKENTRRNFFRFEEKSVIDPRSNNEEGEEKH